MSAELGSGLLVQGIYGFKVGADRAQKETPHLLWNRGSINIPCGEWEEITI